jgi:hypothetical protein
MTLDKARGATLAAIVVSCTQPGGEPKPIADSGLDAASQTDSGNDSGVADDGPLQPQEFDLGLDFSFSLNPSGPWRYGYTGGTVLHVESFLLDSFGAGPTDGGVGIWHPSDAGGTFTPVSNPDDGGGGYYPYVACNPGSGTVVYSASWAARPREIAMEASNAGQLSVVEFIAPQPGQYLIEAHFEGIHFRLSTTDVHVLLDDTQLWGSTIDGYGGDPAFHAVVGPSPAADYSGTVALQGSDVVTFAVGYGADDTNYNDTTGLSVHVSRLGP